MPSNIKVNNGIDTESSYPYEARDATCRFKRADVGATDTGYVDVRKSDERALEQAVTTVGPISVAIDASHRSFQLYKSGGRFFNLSFFLLLIITNGFVHFATSQVAHPLDLTTVFSLLVLVHKVAKTIGSSKIGEC